MEQAFRWAFIGTGRLAGEVAKEITASGRHRITSVYTRRPERCAEFAAAYGAYAAASAEEAVSRPDVDGVYIVTPHTSHAEYSLLSMRLGRPVLCEKPVTTDARQAAEMIRLSEEKGIYFSEAMWTWFSPVANKVKEWLDAGEYGEILECHLNYRGQGIHYAPRVTDPAVAGGALLDIGIYPLTYIYRLFGKPETIECSGILSGGIDMGEDVRMTYPGGKVLTWSTSLQDDRETENLTLEGTKARTFIRNFHYANSATLERADGSSETFSGYGGMLNEFDLAAAEMREGRTESAFVPHRATLDVMEMMDECRRQMGLVYPFEKA